jgi:hypothetical protein
MKIRYLSCVLFLKKEEIMVFNWGFLNSSPSRMPFVNKYCCFIFFSLKVYQDYLFTDFKDIVFLLFNCFKRLKFLMIFCFKSYIIYSILFIEILERKKVVGLNFEVV